MLGAPYCGACMVWMVSAEVRNGVGWACPKCGKHGSEPGTRHGWINTPGVVDFVHAICTQPEGKR